MEFVVAYDCRVEDVDCFIKASYSPQVPDSHSSRQNNCLVCYFVDLVTKPMKVDRIRISGIKHYHKTEKKKKIPTTFDFAESFSC